LIDSQEHQYPNKNLIQQSKEKPKQKSKKNQLSKIQRKTEKTNVPENRVFLNQLIKTKQNPDPQSKHPLKTI
jgi:hypothetical protein